jgi:ribonuclease P protein subunit POP4
VKYTSAHPFTPEFVQGHLKKGNNNNTSRARALYDQRVRRRQVGLVERKDKNGSQREKKQKAKGKEDIARARARMGRREAAEKGVWRLRADEARYGLRVLLSIFSSSDFLGIFTLRWDGFVPLHRLWLGYMSELLGLGPAPLQKEGGAKGPSLSAPAPTPTLPQPAGTIHAKLIKADFHGSIMTGESFSRLCVLASFPVSRLRGGGERYGWARA